MTYTAGGWVDTQFHWQFIWFRYKKRNNLFASRQIHAHIWREREEKRVQHTRSIYFLFFPSFSFSFTWDAFFHLFPLLVSIFIIHVQGPNDYFNFLTLIYCTNEFDFGFDAKNTFAPFSQMCQIIQLIYPSFSLDICISRDREKEIEAKENRNTAVAVAVATVVDTISSYIMKHIETQYWYCCFTKQQNICEKLPCGLK